MRTKNILAAVAAALVVSCTPQPARQSVSVEKIPPPPRPVVHERHEPAAEDASRAALDFSDALTDTEAMGFTAVQRGVHFEELGFDEYARTADSAEVEIVTPVGPVKGGRVRIYLQRGFIDDAIADLIRLNPFGGADVSAVVGADDADAAVAVITAIAVADGISVIDDAVVAGAGERRIFNVTDSTHRRLEFTMTETIRRADGRRVTSLDFIELWSRFVKSRPAQGLAFFRNVQGTEEFINGTAPLLNGLSAADEHVIRIRLGRPDPLAFHRLNTSKLIGGPFMLGVYFSAGVRDGEAMFLPNANTLSDTAYLAECVIKMGGDPDAMASFSLGQYTAMTLYSSPDLERARSEFANSASLRRLPADRYFLAFRTENEQARVFVRNHVDGASLLKNTVNAEGEAISAVVATPQTTVPRASSVNAPQLQRPFRIIYRSDDPISRAVAARVSADLNAAGMETESAGANAEGYERALVSGQYDCAVGWVSETVLENHTEQLHLASIWFNDETDTRKRLNEFREIPLFSVNNYILLRDDLRLHNNKLSGMWTDSGDQY
jgi:hypothetical protein